MDMFKDLLRLWKSREINKGNLQKAVVKGWITEEQKNIILNTEQNPKK